MDNLKLGIIFIIISLLFGALLLSFNHSLNQQYQTMGCEVNEACRGVENNVSLTNIGFGFFGFMLGLGFYILLFNKSEERIMKRLEDEKNEKISEQKFNHILMALDSYEQKVLKKIKEQDGITQNTLRLKTDLSKAKLSYVPQELEKRNLIKRIKKGKTLEIFLKV